MSGLRLGLQGLTAKWDSDRFDKHQLRYQMIRKVFVLLLKIMIEENRLCILYSLVIVRLYFYFFFCLLLQKKYCCIFIGSIYRLW